MDIAEDTTAAAVATFGTTAVTLSLCSSTLSILGSFVIFASYKLVPAIRESTRRLVTCLTLADFLTSLGVLISALAYFAGTAESVCMAQSVLTTYSSLVSFFLTVAIAIHIFATVIHRHGNTSTWKLLLIANVVSWIIPVITAGEFGVLGRENNKRTDTRSWCWLGRYDNEHYLVWMLITGKGWELLCYLLTTALYLLLKFYLYLRHRYQSFATIHESLRDEDKNFLYVCFLLYVLRIWGSIRSVMSLTEADKSNLGDKLSTAFMYMQAIGDPGQAFCNCILFCLLDRTIRRHLFGSCHVNKLNEEDGLQDERISLLSHGQCIDDKYSKDTETLESSVKVNGKMLGHSTQYSSVI